jgi:hypothetical protein
MNLICFELHRLVYDEILSSGHVLCQVAMLYVSAQSDALYPRFWQSCALDDAPALNYPTRIAQYPVIILLPHGILVPTSGLIDHSYGGATSATNAGCGQTSTLLYCLTVLKVADNVSVVILVAVLIHQAVTSPSRSPGTVRNRRCRPHLSAYRAAYCQYCKSGQNNIASRWRAYLLSRTDTMIDDQPMIQSHLDRSTLDKSSPPRSRLCWPRMVPRLLRSGSFGSLVSDSGRAIEMYGMTRRPLVASDCISGRVNIVAS